ncbi:hypothetical protein C8R44DRAFT_857999 [Mycena epipterygia]|nr:hypothetical protein C8R44DRAFT_857999 [Mycena epipterygia]
MSSGFPFLLRFLALSVIVAPALSQLSSGCFENGGETLGDCSAFVPQFCDNVAQNSITNTASQCFNSGSFKCDLTALNQATTASFANSNDCIIALLRVRAIFVTSLLRVALGNFVTLMGIGESSSL